MGCGSSTAAADQTSGQTQTTGKRYNRTQITPASKTETSPKPRAKETRKSSANSFVDVALQAHNQYRCKHGAPPLRVAKDLVEYSQNWANDIASRDTMQHSKTTLPSGGRVGENIYYYWSSDGATIQPSNAQDAVDAWYNEITDYNFRVPGFKKGTGHFTQVIWKGSSEMGVAAATSKAGSVYVVANYRPAGNMMGAFLDHVLPLGTPVTMDPPAKEQHGRSGGKGTKPGGRSFVDVGVQAHNKYRSIHDAPPMHAADDLTAYSQTWADEIAKRDTMEHSKCTLPSGGRIGENIYCYWSSTGAEISDSQAGDAVKAWYDEIKDYNFNRATFSMKTGHFTQVVWKGSTEVGIAAAASKGGTVYVVANYRPAGNMMGDFPGNVVPARR